MPIERVEPIRPFEHLEAELEQEYAARVEYHRGKFAKKLRWLLEEWRDRGTDTPS